MSDHALTEEQLTGLFNRIRQGMHIHGAARDMGILAEVQLAMLTDSELAADLRRARRAYRESQHAWKKQSTANKLARDIKATGQRVV